MDEQIVNLNKLNSGSLESLQPGETLLIRANKIGGGKIQLEFAEKISANNRPVSALTILNASDSRFSSGARRNWMNAEPLDATETFGVNFNDDGDWYASDRTNSRGETIETMDLDILYPSWNGKLYFKVVVLESLTPAPGQVSWANNPELNKDGITVQERYAKRAGRDGDFITHKGQYIFSNTDVHMLEKDVKAQHVFLESDNTRLGVQSNTGVTEKEVEKTLDM